MTTPDNFHFSFEDYEAEATPEDLPNYELTDIKFNAVMGNIDDEDNEIMKFHFTKFMKLCKHMRNNPRDVENGNDIDMYKEHLGKMITILQLDGHTLGSDQPW